MGLNPIVPTIPYSIIRLFGAAGGAAGGGTASTGRASSTFELTTAGKGKGRHHPLNFFAFTFWAGDLFGGIEYQFFEFVFALTAMIFINRHLTYSS